MQSDSRLMLGSVQIQSRREFNLNRGHLKIPDRWEDARSQSEEWFHPNIMTNKDFLCNFSIICVYWHDVHRTLT